MIVNRDDLSEKTDELVLSTVHGRDGGIYLNAQGQWPSYLRSETLYMIILSDISSP